ncbi:MAG: hypothetical protein U1C56_02710, partial [Candidatus Curtissbacteria bacterium]|nr:hypothetical protein [Candidatus Curtissbacteria bacterium]
MKNVSKLKNSLMNFLRIFSLAVLVLVTMSPSMVVQAAIDPTDYFQLTAAGNATTMDAGGSLVFTLNAKTMAGGAKTLAGSDYAVINIWPMMGGGGPEGVAADVTAIGGGATLKASATAPWGEGTTAADIDGANDKLVAVNVDETGTGTFTVTATESFGVCVGAEGA